MPDPSLIMPPPLSQTVFPGLIYQCEKDPEREQGVRSFLNGIIAGRNGLFIEKIISTMIESTQPAEHLGERFSRLDLVAETQDGSVCLVELQLSRMTHIIPRMLSYFGVHRTRNVQPGRTNFSMPKYALIAIIDYAFPLLEDEPYFHLYTTMAAENAPHLKLTEQLQLHLVSLHRFRELKVEPGDVLSNWMHYFSGDYTHPERVEELIDMTKEIRGLEDTYRRMISDPELWRQYQYEQLARADYLAELAEQQEKGKAEGWAEGEAAEKASTAKRLLAMGLSLEQVAEGSGLPMDEIKKLAERAGR